mmetsp:Transcript_44664/g.111185  ORF Transcript_44664/g.111185 Transcript_44664/m.111185 type:complete len:138 (-) Transcript_44664:346-759(-)
MSPSSRHSRKERKCSLRLFASGSALPAAIGDEVAEVPVAPQDGAGARWASASGGAAAGGTLVEKAANASNMSRLDEEAEEAACGALDGAEADVKLDEEADMVACGALSGGGEADVKLDEEADVVACGALDWAGAVGV